MWTYGLGAFGGAGGLDRAQVEGKLARSARLGCPLVLGAGLGQRRSWQTGEMTFLASRFRPQRLLLPWAPNDRIGDFKHVLQLYTEPLVRLAAVMDRRENIVQGAPDRCWLGIEPRREVTNAVDV